MSKTVIIVDEHLFNKLVGKIENLTEKVDAISLDKSNGLKEKWLITDEVCKLLNISRRTLQKMRDSGSIKFIKTGKKIYYKATDVESYLESHS